MQLLGMWSSVSIIRGGQGTSSPDYPICIEMIRESKDKVILWKARRAIGAPVIYRDISLSYVYNNMPYTSRSTGSLRVLARDSLP